MRCSDFLSLYSDYRDGTLRSPWLRRRLLQHLASCDECARYDGILNTGIDALRSVEPIEPSDRFRVRLRCRLALAQRRTPRATFPWPARVAAAAIVAALLVGGITKTLNEEPIEPSLTQPGRRVSAGSSPTGVGPATFADFRLPAFGTVPEPAPAFDSLVQVPLVNQPGPSVFTVNASVSR